MISNLFFQGESYRVVPIVNQRYDTWSDCGKHPRVHDGFLGHEDMNSAKDLLRYYKDGMLSYNELVCHLSELPEEEIDKLKPTLKAQALKVKRLVASGETTIIRGGSNAGHAPPDYEDYHRPWTFKDSMAAWKRREHK